MRHGALLSERGKERISSEIAAEEMAAAIVEAAEKSKRFDALKAQRASMAEAETRTEQEDLRAFEARERATTFRDPTEEDVLMLPPAEPPAGASIGDVRTFFALEAAEATAVAPPTSRQQLLLDALQAE